MLTQLLPRIPSEILLGLLFLAGLAMLFIIIPLSVIKLRKQYWLIALFAMPMLAIMLYLHWGNPETIVHQKALALIENELEKIIAQQSLAQPNVQQALQAIQDQIKSSDLALIRLGSIYIELGFFDDAIGLYEQLLKQHKYSEQVLTQWVYAYSLKHNGKIPANIRKLAEKEAANIPAQTVLLNLFAIDDFLQGNYAQAIQSWETILKIDKNLSEDKKITFRSAIGTANDRLKSVRME